MSPASRRALAAIPLAVGATVLSATAAMAAPPSPGLTSADARATAHVGNVTACAQAGLSGTTIDSLGTADATNVTVTVTAAAVPAGDTVTAVVVKGGAAYNVYTSASLGSMPWIGLHSPLNGGGNIPTISHWFACVTTSGETSTSAPTGTTGATGSSNPTSGTTSASGSGTTGAPASAPSSSAAAAANATTPAATNGDHLAKTGSPTPWIATAAGGALLVGAAALGLTRSVRRRSSTD